MRKALRGIRYLAFKVWHEDSVHNYLKKIYFKLISSLAETSDFNFAAICAGLSYFEERLSLSVSHPKHDQMWPDKSHS